ncbi:MAG TPA: DUF3488 and transglutaminase-like domain-containing protein, partial [Actinomycetota bacterium]|nr:DUF3488 and transglutaminase-like domain-containing protein [Actinomycetota bacterium]
MATTDSPVGARGTDYAQALTLAGLLAGASLSLSRLYQDAGWVPAVWLSIACALGLAALLRRLGVGQLLSLVAMVAGFIVVTGVLLFPETLLVVIPTGDTFASMAQATRDALRGVSQQAAPVSVTQDFLFLTCAGAWAVTTAADGLAFRARAPLLALVPVLGLFVFPALIRDTSPAWYAAWFLLGGAGLLLFESRARLASWGRWVSSPRARPASGWRLPLTRANSIGRWMLAVAALLALSLAWLLPGYGQRPLLDYRKGPNANATIAINPFVSLRTRLNSDENIPVFDVRTAQPSYYRLIVDDRFDGVTFTPSSPGQLVEFGGDTSLDLDGSPTRQVTQRFTIRGLAGPSGYLPAAQTAVSIRAGRSRVYQSPTNRDLTLRRPLRSGLTYTVTSRVPTPTAADLSGPKSYESIPQVRPYMNASNIDPRVQSLTFNITRDKPDPFAKALAIQDYLRSPAFKYNLDVPRLSDGGNQLRRFLLEVREGYCEQFAAAMAAMARVAGIPSRVAIGFTSGVPAGDHWEVGSKDAHAWPELFFPGVGWVRFEPTPRGDGQVDVPSYTTPTGRQISPATTVTTAPGSSDATGDSQSNAANRLEAENADPANQLGTPESGRQRAARRGIVALIVLLALVSMVPATKLVRTALARRRAGRRPRDAVAEAYNELTGWAGDAGIGRRGAETPTAYAQRMAGEFDEDARPLGELTVLYVSAEYAPGEPSGGDAAQARKLARAARGRLAGRLG